ncbi:MAG TPA: hypothetical protein VLI45_09100 [Acidobacteriaceae bacterium]|nr:hypothetical protein [Acidobacteriaceae bacterium]
MHSLRQIQRAGELDRDSTSALQHNVFNGLTLHPTQRLSVDTALQLKALWDQTIARYPKQELGPLTTEMYLSEWEEMVVRYKIEPFAAALSKVIRDRARAPFFPEPHEIEAELRSETSLRAGRKAVTQIDAWKAQWLREREEDIAAGIPRAVIVRSPRRQLGRTVEPRHSDAEIAAVIAAIPKADMEDVRDRMRRMREVTTQEAPAQTVA